MALLVLVMFGVPVMVLLVLGVLILLLLELGLELLPVEGLEPIWFNVTLPESQTRSN